MAATFDEQTESVLPIGSHIKLNAADIDFIGGEVLSEVNDHGILLGNASMGIPAALSEFSKYALQYLNNFQHEPPIELKRFSILALETYNKNTHRVLDSRAATIEPLPDAFLLLMFRLMNRRPPSTETAEFIQRTTFLAAYTAIHIPAEKTSIRTELAKAWCFLEGNGTPDNRRKGIKLELILDFANNLRPNLEGAHQQIHQSFYEYRCLKGNTPPDNKYKYLTNDAFREYIRAIPIADNWSEKPFNE